MLTQTELDANAARVRETYFKSPRREIRAVRTTIRSFLYKRRADLLARERDSGAAFVEAESILDTTCDVIASAMSADEFCAELETGNVVECERYEYRLDLSPCEILIAKLSGRDMLARNGDHGWSRCEIATACREFTRGVDNVYALYHALSNGLSVYSKAREFKLS
jgi:hypothetical protein